MSPFVKIFKLLGSVAFRTAFELLLKLLSDILKCIKDIRDLVDDGELNDSVECSQLNRVILILEQLSTSSALALSDLSGLLQVFDRSKNLPKRVKKDGKVCS